MGSYVVVGEKERSISFLNFLDAGGWIDFEVDGTVTGSNRVAQDGPQGRQTQGLVVGFDLLGQLSGEVLVDTLPVIPL